MRSKILKIHSLIVALLLSAGQLVANQCSGDVDSCTPMQLCAAATTNNNGQKVWATDTSLLAHVKTAQSIGIDCGVIEVVTSCNTDPQFCSITELCQQATLVKDNKAIWKTDSNAAGYVALAKDYRLQCEPLKSYLENEVTDPQAETRYISTGFWVKAPIAPRTDKKLELVISDSTFSDHKISYDPPSLLNLTEIEKSDVSPNKQSNPPRFGQTFELNSLGLVIANPTGALSQEGHFVYLGKPVKTPPKRVKNLSVTSPVLLRMAKIRPRARPIALAETKDGSELTIFESKTPPVCWIEAIPVKSTARKDNRLVSVKRGEIRLIVAIRPDQQNTKNIFVSLGYPIRDYSAEISIENKNIQLKNRGRIAW